LKPGSRVEASFQGKWYSGILKRVARSKPEPYGVKCDSDKNNSMMLWVPRRNLRLPQTMKSLNCRSLQLGQQLNRALLERKVEEAKSDEKEITSSPGKRKEGQKKAQAGRRRSAQSTINWNSYEQMHRGRKVTKGYTQGSEINSMKPAPLKSEPIALKSSPNPSPSPKYGIQGQMKFGVHITTKPNDGKRVRKKKINPDYLWGDDLRNPKRALVAKLEKSRQNRDSNQDVCGICQDGGDLLCCDGPCLRAFHFKCLEIRAEDLPDGEWFCNTCTAPARAMEVNKPASQSSVVSKQPRKMTKKGRPRPAALDIPQRSSTSSNQTSLKVDVKRRDSQERKQGKRGRKARPPELIFGRSLIAGKSPITPITPCSEPCLSTSVTPRPSRRNAGIPMRFKDSYLTLSTPQATPMRGAKRLAKSEPNKGNKKQKTGAESVQETKARLEKRLRALESYLNTKPTPSPTPMPTPTQVAPPFINLSATMPAPRTPRTPLTPGTPFSTASAPELSSFRMSSTEGLEPWRRCAECKTGRRSMTCAKNMCAVCCRSTGACVTHFRFLPGDILRVFKGPLQGREGEMVAKKGRIISVRFDTLLYLDENTLCLVRKGPSHDLDNGTRTNKPKRAMGKQCLNCMKRFRNRNALASHQRSCRPISAGDRVITPFGSGILQKSCGPIAEVKLRFATGYMQTSLCRKPPKPAAPKHKRKRKTPQPSPTDLQQIQAPRVKRQTSKPLRYRKAELSKPMLYCFEVIEALKRHKYGTLFSEPVPKSVPGYHDVIKTPMDLGTVEKMLFEKDYDMQKFEADVFLIWDNATKFNPANHPVHEMAVTLRKIFVERFEKAQQQVKSLERLVKQKQRPRRPKVEGLDMEVKKLAQKMEMMRKRLQNMSGGCSASSSQKRHVRRPVTYTERQVLKQQIISLPPEHLTGVAEIVRDSMPDDSATEIEIDLEALDAPTLRKLQKYVGTCMLKMEASGGIRESSSDEEESDSDA